MTELEMRCAVRKAERDALKQKDKAAQARRLATKYRQRSRRLANSNLALKHKLKTTRATAMALIDQKTDIKLLDSGDKELMRSLYAEGIEVKDIADKFAVDMVTAAVVIEWHDSQ